MLDGIPPGLPALLLAGKMLLPRARTAGSGVPTADLTRPRRRRRRWTRSATAGIGELLLALVAIGAPSAGSTRRRPCARAPFASYVASAVRAAEAIRPLADPVAAACVGCARRLRHSRRRSLSRSARALNR